MLRKDWHAALKRLRLEASLSQQRAAEECGLSKRMFQYYESGEYQPKEPMAIYYVSRLESAARKLLKIRQL